LSVEHDELVKKNDILEEKVVELQADKKSLQKEVDDKMRLIRERREHQDKTHEARIRGEVQRTFEAEKELLLIQIDDLKQENDKYLEEIQKIEKELFMYKSTHKTKSESQGEIRKLKQEIISL